MKIKFTKDNLNALCEVCNKTDDELYNSHLVISELYRIQRDDGIDCKRAIRKQSRVINSLYKNYLL